MVWLSIFFSVCVCLFAFLWFCLSIGIINLGYYFWTLKYRSVKLGIELCYKVLSVSSLHLDTWLWSQSWTLLDVFVYCASLVIHSQQGLKTVVNSLTSGRFFSLLVSTKLEISTLIIFVYVCMCIDVCVLLQVEMNTDNKIILWFANVCFCPLFQWSRDRMLQMLQNQVPTYTISLFNCLNCC